MKYFLPLIFTIGVVFAQSVSVNATVDSSSVVLGGPIRYAVEVKHPSGLPVFFPALKDTIGAFDIVAQDSALRTEQNGQVEWKKTYIIANYTPGSRYIDPYIVRFTQPDGHRDSAMSNPIPVEIRGVAIDTTASIRDVKAPMSLPITLEDIAIYLVIMVLLAGIGFGIYYFVQKGKNRPIIVAAPVPPDIPPHVLAMMRLEQLEGKKLWQAGEVKAYYSEATEIVRAYFEARFHIMALEMTTGEVMQQLSRFPMETGTPAVIESFLSGADLVKFAKYQPIASENEQVIKDARVIIERTMPVPEAPASSQRAAG